MKRLVADYGKAVLVELEEQEKKYGAIIIPDMGKEKPIVARIVDIAPTFNFHRGDFFESKFKVGDVVTIPLMGAQRISLEGTDYLVVSNNELMAGIVEE